MKACEIRRRAQTKRNASATEHAREISIRQDIIFRMREEKPVMRRASFPAEIDGILARAVRPVNTLFCFFAVLRFRKGSAGAAEDDITVKVCYTLPVWRPWE